MLGGVHRQSQTIPFVLGLWFILAMTGIVSAPQLACHSNRQSHRAVSNDAETRIVLRSA